MNKPRGVLIDLGNTVMRNVSFDFNEGIKVLYRHLKNRSLSYDELLLYAIKLKETTLDLRTLESIEVDFRKYLGYLINYLNLEIDITLSKLEIEMAKAIDKTKIIPGVKEILTYFNNNGILVMALSNSTFSNTAIKAKLRQHGLLKYLDFVIVSSNYLFRKPSPWIFKMGLKKLNFEADEVWMIGNDYEADIIGAKECGLFTVWFNTLAEEDHHQVADLNVRNYYELLYLLNELS